MNLKFSGAALTAAVLAFTGTLLTTPSAQADSEEYVALGDSYSSGTGTRNYIDDGTNCQRSPVAFASLITADRGYDLDFRACSGATIPNVSGNQVDALGATTDFVTVSVGGNDAGFADVLTECAKPGWMSDCGAAIDGAEAFVNNALPGKLAGLYSSISSAAPGAQVVVVGYPRIFNGEDCNALTWFSPAEEARLNAMADLLNAKTSSVAGAAGFGFANPTGRFSGHAVCDNPEYLNGLSSPISESFHPNSLGHSSGYAPTVSPVLTGAALKVDPALVAVANGQAEDLAATQRKYADRDAAIEPETFVAPDLESPAAKTAARKAGVDIDAFVERSSTRR
ncbi:MAG: SGNH/GDSL hydrolase family protein [Nocardioides sp.]|nr:SGNH/GDSL hydrolase family protein [Nocardioides sp.]